MCVCGACKLNIIKKIKLKKKKKRKKKKKKRNKSYKLVVINRDAIESLTI